MSVLMLVCAAAWVMLTTSCHEVKTQSSLSVCLSVCTLMYSQRLSVWLGTKVQRVRVCAYAFVCVCQDVIEMNCF